MQGYLRNPLADPGLIGVSGFGGFGAVWRSDGAGGNWPAWRCPRWRLAVLYWVVLLVLLLAARGATSLRWIQLVSRYPLLPQLDALC